MTQPRSAAILAIITTPALPISADAMVNRALLTAVMLAGAPGVALAFSSRLGLAPTSSLRFPRATECTLHLARLPDDDGVPSIDAAVQKRRAFLANFAASSLLPLLTLTNPSSASARGFGANEKGPLVYGGDELMAQKEHGTTAAPVQENLRYSVSRKLADKICSFNR